MTTSTSMNMVRLTRLMNGLPADPMTTRKRSPEADQREKLLAQITPAELATLEQQKTHGAAPTARVRVSLGCSVQAATTLAIFQSRKAAIKAKQKGTK